jgi:hypothetical protein
MDSQSTIIPTLPTIRVNTERKSHLPAWLLASTAAVEASKSNRGLLEDRLNGLRKDVLVLETLMDKEKSSYASILAARANAAMLRASQKEDFRHHHHHHHQEKEGMKNDKIRRKTFGLHVLPMDITNVVAQFGGAKELAIFSLTSKKAYDYMAQVLERPERLFFLIFIIIIIIIIFKSYQHHKF